MSELDAYRKAHPDENEALDAAGLLRLAISVPIGTFRPYRAAAA